MDPSVKQENAVHLVWLPQQHLLVPPTTWQRRWSQQHRFPCHYLKDIFPLSGCWGTQREKPLIVPNLTSHHWYLSIRLLTKTLSVLQPWYPSLGFIPGFMRCLAKPSAVLWAVSKNRSSKQNCLYLKEMHRAPNLKHFTECKA